MPANAWDALLNCLDPADRTEFELQVEKIEFKPDKRAIGIELKNRDGTSGRRSQVGEWRDAEVRRPV